MHDPIEGRFRVVGEKPPYEPIIKDWRGLWAFIGVFVVACLLNTGRIMLENSRGDSPSDASRSAAAEQPPSRSLSLEHLP